MTNQTPDQAAAADNKARRARMEEDRKAQDEQIAKDRADMEKRNLEKMQADAKLRPTPTPDEVLKAMAGHNVDHKEPDGSPQQNPAHPIANAAQQIEVGRKLPEAQPAPGNEGHTLSPKQQAEADHKTQSAAAKK